MDYIDLEREDFHIEEHFGTEDFHTEEHCFTEENWSQVTLEAKSLDGAAGMYTDSQLRASEIDLGVKAPMDFRDLAGFIEGDVEYGKIYDMLLSSAAPALVRRALLLRNRQVAHPWEWYHRGWPGGRYHHQT